MTERLGYDRHGLSRKNGGDRRADRRAKAVVTDVGPVQITVPQDGRLLRAADRHPARRRRRPAGVDDRVLSLPEGLIHGKPGQGGHGPTTEVSAGPDLDIGATTPCAGR
ncbi:hypothetical protein ACFWD7_54680 [Streptomyces mirabilis]|uniref:hypothetical protein n=1 Tax=Streptomyces mirabilis TaxID=68239 RepID=UPI00368CD46F